MNELIDTTIHCPYCGEAIDVIVEPLEEDQSYIEDCQVCCRPIHFDISVSADGEQHITVRSENETY